MKISNLLEKDFKLVEKKKIWFIIPACIVAVAIIVMIVFGVTTGEPLNLSMDFQGGYTMQVTLSTKLTDDTYDSYRNEIVNVIENLTDDNDQPYGLKVAGTQRQGSGETASIYVRYKAIAADAVMEDEINPAIQKALQDRIFKIVPTVENTDTAYAVHFANFPLNKAACEEKVAQIQSLAQEKGITVTGVTYNDNVSPDSFVFEDILNDDGTIQTKGQGVTAIRFTVSQQNEEFRNGLSDALAINDKYSGQAVRGDSVSATVSGELLTNALLAICLSIVLMLVYIAFRFEVSSGISAIMALLHDILIMFSFMAIFRIEISSTFIAALITILGYSINNTIIVFDRIRENSKSLYYKNSTATFIANQSIRETLVRSINTSITTLLTITMVAIIGVPSIRIFALPIIVGLLAGPFSSIFISPSIWAMWKDRKKKPTKLDQEKKGEKKVALA